MFHPASDGQLERIRELSLRHYGDSLAIFETVGEPIDRFAASRVLAAIGDGGHSLEEILASVGGRVDAPIEITSVERAAAKVEKSAATPIDRRVVQGRGGRERVCQTCGEMKDLSEFRARGRGKSRVCAQCEDAERSGPRFKRCGVCQEVKAVEEFSLDASRADGFDSKCRSCKATVAKEGRVERKRHPRTTLTVLLEDGEVELVVVANVFSLSEKDRAFVFGLTDLMRQHPGFVDE